MPPASILPGSPLGTAKASRKIIAIAALSLGALIAMVWAFFRHPIPEEIEVQGPWSICGTSLSAPFEVRYVDSLLDGGSMIFVIRDGLGKRCAVISQWERTATAYERLYFSPSLPMPTAWSQWLEITHDRERVRNVIYHAMARQGFHASFVERWMAGNLYPSIYDRLMFWLKDLR